MSISSIVAIAGGGQGSDANISPGRSSLDVVSVAPSSTSFLRSGDGMHQRHHRRDHYPRANVVMSTATSPRTGTQRDHNRSYTPPPNAAHMRRQQVGLVQTHRAVARKLREEMETDLRNGRQKKEPPPPSVDQPYVTSLVRSPFLAAPTSTRPPKDLETGSHTASTTVTPIKGHSRSELIVKLQRENSDLKAELDSQIGFLAILQERLSQEQEHANYRSLVLEAEGAQRKFLLEQEQEAYTLLCTFESLFVKQLLEAENSQHQRDVLHAMEIQSVIEEAGSVTSELQGKLRRYEALHRHTQDTQTDDVIIVSEEKKPPLMIDSCTSMYLPQYVVKSVLGDHTGASSPEPRNPHSGAGKSSPSPALGSQQGFTSSAEEVLVAYFDEEEVVNPDDEGNMKRRRRSGKSEWASTSLLETPLDLYLDTLERPQFFTQLYAAVKKRQGGGSLFGQEVPWLASSSVQTIPDRENLGIILKKAYDGYRQETKGLLAGFLAASQSLMFECLYIKRSTSSRSTWCTFGAASKWPLLQHQPSKAVSEEHHMSADEDNESKRRMGLQEEKGTTATQGLFSLIDSAAEQPYNPAQQLDRSKLQIATLKSENRRLHFQVARTDAVLERSLAERTLAVDQVVLENQLRVKLENRLKDYEAVLGELDAELHVEEGNTTPTPRRRTPKPIAKTEKSLFSPSREIDGGTSALEALALASTPISEKNQEGYSGVPTVANLEEEAEVLRSELGDDAHSLRRVIVAERKEFKESLERALSSASLKQTHPDAGHHQQQQTFISPLLKSLATALGDATDAIPKAILVLKKVKKAINDDNEELDALLHASQHANISAAVSSGSEGNCKPLAPGNALPPPNLPYRKRLWSIKSEAQESISNLATIQTLLIKELTKEHLEILVDGAECLRQDFKSKKNNESHILGKGSTYVDHGEVGWYSPKDCSSPPPPMSRRQRTPLRSVTNTHQEPLSTSRDPVLSRAGYAHRGNLPTHAASPWTAGKTQGRKGPGVYHGKGTGTSSPKDQRFLW